MPKNFYLGGGLGETLISPAAAVLIVLCVAVVVFLPRRYAITFALLGALLIPAGNVVVVGGIHLQAVRFIALFGILRLLRSKWGGSGPLFAGGINSIDRAVLGWALGSATAFILLWHTSGAFVNKSGFLLGILGLY